MSDSTPPDFLTVMEAGRILRLGRSRAYDEARLYERTNGAEGLIPVKRAGRIFRVPRALLEEVAGGPIQLDLDIEPASATQPSTDDAPEALRLRRRRRRLTRLRGSLGAWR